VAGPDRDRGRDCTRLVLEVRTLTLSPRNRELAFLFVVGALTAVGFASVYIARQDVVSASSLTYAGFFFALYLGASARFGLRPFWTWVCLTASLGGTMALATAFNVDGLPALPLLSLGFLVPNADLLWREVRPKLSRSR
jgi:hypothetical protein